MADPTGYTVSYSFSGFQANTPTAPLPGPMLDNELADIAAAVATLVSAIEDIRRTDGALKNGVVTFESFEQGLQLLIDPTNGQLVAAAVAGAQASASAASGSATAAATSATNAGNSASAAAASASSVNLALFLAKANNLAGLGSLPTSRANLGLGSAAVLDAGTSAFNIVQLSGSAKLPAVDGSQLVNVDTLPVGAFIFSTSGSVLPGTVKANGALLSRASFPRLWSYVSTCGNLVSEAAWASGFSGAFSTGDLSTTFRLMDTRGEFIRSFDDARGVDVARNMGSGQADSLKDHTHSYTSPATGAGTGTTPNYFFSSSGGATTGSPSTGAAAETRPRNITLLGCIRY